MKKLSLFMLLLVLFNNTLFSQSKKIILDRLIDIKIGMTYDEVIAKYPDPYSTSIDDITYHYLKLQNGVDVTNLILKFYDNKLYIIFFDYDKSIHAGLKATYGYTPPKGSSINSYYGNSYRSSITACNQQNKYIRIIDNRIQKIVDSIKLSGF
jgi:hypothetical protein